MAVLAIRLINTEKWEASRENEVSNTLLMKQAIEVKKK
jgi:hypothetical protein